MEQRLLLTLLRSLLDLCRRWARRSLHWLLRLFSALSPRLLNGTRLITRGGDKEPCESNQPPELTTYGDARPRDEHFDAPQRPVVLMACSTTPKKPPPARSNTRRTSLESYHMGPTCTSPTSTLRQASGAFSPSLKSPKSPTLCLSDEDGNMIAGHVPPGVTVAEPANILAVPNKPFRSFLPSMTSRYDRNITVGNDLGPWAFKPLETLTVYDELEVPGWEHFVQPEGQLYFSRFLSSRRIRYLTEENLDNAEILAEAERFLRAFERRLDYYKIPPSDVEVVFELHRDHWSYYMVDLDHRHLFWVDDCVIDDSSLPARFGVEHREHIRNLFDFEYWQHIEYFPSHRPVQNGVLDELLGILIQQHIDVKTSLTSTSGYNANELKSMIGSVKKLKTLPNSGHVAPYVAQASARLMCVIANERFYNFFGFNGVRLSPSQSVRGHNGKKERSVLIALLSPILFYAPEIHLSALNRVWVDDVIKARFWKEFQDKIERDWEQFILYATVLVNANVAFLAIPSIISDDLGPALRTSPAGVVSQISIIVSLGSIIIGLLLVRQMRTGAKDSSEDYLRFIESRNHPRLGLETLAILYSLPYALLIWGMTTFLASIAISSFYSMSGDPSVANYIAYGVVWAFVLTFIAWTIHTGWEKNCRSDPPAYSTDSDCDSGTESSGNSDAASGLGLELGPRATRQNSKANTSSILRGSITEEIELEGTDSDARSVHSHRSMRSVRSRLTTTSTVVSSVGRSWRLRRGRNRSGQAEVPRTNGLLSFSWPWRGRGGPTETNRGGLPQFEMRPAV